MDGECQKWHEKWTNYRSMNVAADHNQLSIKNEFFIIHDVIHVV